MVENIDDLVKGLAKRPHRPQPQTNMNFWVKYPEVKVLRKTYPQNWTSYNLAQTSEKLMFMDILNELSGYVVTRKNRMGRPSTNVQEMIFCMGMLIYAGKSTRRIISELHIAKDRNLLRKVPHFNTIIKYFNKQELRQHLEMLITLAAVPLKSVERDFTADASGFATSVFGRWFDHKWGKGEKTQRIWRKAHVMSGTRTNVISSIQITPSNVADTTAFPELLDKTKHNFVVKEVSADMAYSSRKNLMLVSEAGAIPFIPFKSNTSGKSKGCLIWKRMYQYFQENYDEYMVHYHKRSNAETVFSTIKRKFGMNLRTKHETAQDNEILCKALCHNICVLIHECFDLGIDVNIEEYSREAERVKNYFCTQSRDFCTQSQ